MADVRRKKRLLNAIRSCRAKERGANTADSCESCPFQKDGGICREELFSAVAKYIDGTNECMPVETSFNIYGDEAPICPMCERFLRIGFAYCPYCGTEIDWDDYCDEDPYADQEIEYDDYSETSRP